MHLIIILLIITIYLFYRIYSKGIYSVPNKKEYTIITFVLILSIGFRGKGVDNDYEAYVASINQFLAISEPTFLLIASLIKNFNLPIVTLFIIYAFIGVYYKMNVIYKNSALPLVSIIIYLSNIILLQDINQIRAGAATALFLISIQYFIEGRKKLFVLIIIIASLFHFSALLYFSILLIDNKKITYRKYLFWITLPLLGYTFYYIFNQNMIEKIPIEPIRDKLLMYKTLQSMGSEGFSSINLFNPYFIFKLIIYYILMEYYYALYKDNDNITLYIKIFSISLFVFPALGAITPILGYRSSDLFSCIEILLFPYLFTLFKGEKTKVICIACYFILLFSINIFYKHLIYI